MRLIIVVLSVISVTFAGTTVYLALELQAERERPLVASAPAPVPHVTPAMPAQVSQLRAAPPPATRQAAAAPPANVESEEARMKKARLESSRSLINALDDPQRREAMLVQYRVMMRNSYPRLASAIGMTTDEAERLFTLLALQQIETQELYARCELDLNCNLTDGSYIPAEPRARDIADLLGPDRQQQFDTFKNTLMERESVVQLRSRLPESTFPNDRAEALIAALAEERQKIHQEAAERRNGVNGHGNGAGMIFFSNDAPTPEAKFESAKENSRRMRERAAEVLTSEQLRVFNEMQDELLISLREQVLRKEDASSYATATVVH